MSVSTLENFKLNERVYLITGGGGFLGIKHAEAILEAGGKAVLLDVKKDLVNSESMRLNGEYPGRVAGLYCDITNHSAVEDALQFSIKTFGRVDGLINNAANDPKVGPNKAGKALLRFENMSLEAWHSDLAVGLTGAFICSQVIGSHLAEKGDGVILNIASDLAIIAPDQRIYQEHGWEDHEQPTKPVTYSVVKSGLIGLTKYLCTYWASKGVRVNALCPGGVYNGQSNEFVAKLTNLIPMGRMAEADEYKSAVIFLLSNASKYMTGATVVMDGGRTVW